MKSYKEFDRLEAGIDEAGRGPMFGRVYAAAVILNPTIDYDYNLIKDLFPLLSIVEPINITKFIWGEESVYNAEDFTVLGEGSSNLSITFEKSSQQEALINKAILLFNIEL